MTRTKPAFHLPEQQIRLAQILVTATPEIPVPNYKNDDAKDAETAQAKIEMIEQRLRNGEAFDIVAGNYSEDPFQRATGRFGIHSSVGAGENRDRLCGAS